MTMDQERPRSDLSINSRNNLRKVLHLELLYKENKVRALKVWCNVLERSLAMSEPSWVLPSCRRWVAGGSPCLRPGRNRPSQVLTNPKCELGFQAQSGPRPSPWASCVRMCGSEARFDPGPLTVTPCAPSSPRRLFLVRLYLGI